MSIFNEIVSKLFGKAKPDQSPPTVEPTAKPATAPADSATPPASAAATAPLADVDVEGILDKLVAERGEKLNWRTSIVDTMKVLGIDSSLEHRKQLAVELKYSGDTSDSASMNIWLHKELMKALAANGGKLPPELAS